MSSEPEREVIPLTVMFAEEAQSLHSNLQQSLGRSVSTTESGRWTVVNPNGWPNWKSVRRTTLALAGAARTVEAPIVEMVASTLDDVASRLDRCPAPVSSSGVQTCLEAVEVLGNEIEAFASGTAGIDGSKALNLVDKLDAIAPK